MLQRYRKLNVIWDCAKFHHSAEVRIYLWEHRDPTRLEMLPAYSPDANPMERVGWPVREHMTPNH